MTVDPAFMSMSEIAAGLARGDFSSTEMAQLYLQRIDKANQKLHAYVALDAEMTLALAKAADDRRARGICLSPLDGVPFAAKDLCALEGQVMTVGSQAWVDRRSEGHCTVLMKCLQAGMVLLGRTHMVEFAFGGWGTNPVMGTPWNPWDLQTPRAPGGSSSGSGVAVAAGLAPAAIGSDTGGSVRIPAGLNGITGLKTTRGLISLHGAFPLSFTLDTFGPMGRSALDAALWTQIMAGPDPADPSSLGRPAFLWDGLEPEDKAQPLKGLRVAVMSEAQFPIEVHAEELAAFERTCQVLRELGASLQTLELPFDFNDLMVRNGQIIAAEAYRVHQAYIEDESLPLGPYVRQRVLGGKSISAAQYIDAVQHHRASTHQFSALMRNYAALVTPTFPFPAVALSEIDEAQTPMATFCRAGNYLTACGLALPAGLSSEGLPLSVQLMGPSFTESTVLKLGVALQEATQWHRAAPDLSELGL